jgi:hypothetical protein
VQANQDKDRCGFVDTSFVLEHMSRNLNTKLGHRVIGSLPEEHFSYGPSVGITNHAFER